MRAAGVIETVFTARDHDHVCFGFTDVAEFQAAALSFLAQGLAMGQLVQLVMGEPGECGQWRSALEFIDHNSLLAPDVAGRTRAGTVVLRTGRPHIHQLVDLLELPAVHVEVVA